MNVQLRRLGILQMGTLLAVLYGFFGIFLLPFFLIAVFTQPEVRIGMIFAFILYPLMGFTGGIIFAALYNLAAKVVGGIKIEFDTQTTLPTDRDDAAVRY